MPFFTLNATIKCSENNTSHVLIYSSEKHAEIVALKLKDRKKQTVTHFLSNLENSLTREVALEGIRINSAR